MTSIKTIAAASLAAGLSLLSVSGNAALACFSTSDSWLEPMKSPLANSEPRGLWGQSSLSLAVLGDYDQNAVTRLLSHGLGSGSDVDA